MKIRNVIKFFVFLALTLLVSLGSAVAQDDFGIPLMEGTSLDIGNGYYFNVVDVDPYYGEARFQVTYNGIEQMNYVYYMYSSFYYADDYLILSFDITDTVTESGTDYVIISNVYLYSWENPTGSVVITTFPSDVDVYFDEYYIGTTRAHYTNSLWINNIQEGYHDVTLEREGYFSNSESIYVSPGETSYYYCELESSILYDEGYDTDPELDFLYEIIGLLTLSFLIIVLLVILLVIIILLRRKKHKEKSSDISYEKH